MSIASLSRRTILAAAAIAAPAILRAETWPEGRTITMLVPFPPGGGTDVVARVVADRMAQVLKCRFVVENRPGGGGSIGYGAATRAAPDGATVMLTSSAIATMPFLYPKRGYDPLRELTPVSLVGAGPSLLCVGPSVKAANLAELIADAKRNPGGLTYASAGIGSGLHLAAELFVKLAGVEIRHVPYKGASLATGDLLGGRIDMIVDILSSVQSLVTDGKLRALGITTAKPSPLAPGVPPVANTVPGYDYSAWFGLFLPPGASPAMAETLAAGLKDALASPALQERAATLGFEPAGTSPAEFSAYFAADLDRWGKLIRELGITSDG